MARLDDPQLQLLFGVLALENGLIDQGQLLDAVQAWTRDKSHRLADYMPDGDGLGAERRAVVDALVALHVKTHGGDAEKSLASIRAGVSTRESLADLGDTQLEAMVAQLGSGLTYQVGDPDASASCGRLSTMSDGQRFRVLRPHARGGLGAVFVALDRELNREVALKQILDEHADDPRCRSRFLLEAEITGGLEHPGIVPVYGLGRYDGGRPYYAMRFVRGDSLKDAVAQYRADTALKVNAGRRAVELRKFIRRFLDVCNAIEYAHSRGVLHRDIKPGNVIVGKHGETLVVDWGLAKAAGRADHSASDEQAIVPSSDSGHAETRPGSAMGTPAYMSPEQAAGDIDRLGPRSDVYCLGATLYHLLTGTAPFDGDVAEVLKNVQRGEFRPPRQVDPTVDPALEAVCLKAMALEPADRYASPKALGDDVELWLADEPVSARRDSLFTRAWCWVRKHRTLTTSAAAVALVSLAALGVVYRREAGYASVLAASNRELDRKNTELLASSERERRRFDLCARRSSRSPRGCARTRPSKTPTSNPSGPSYLAARKSFIASSRAC